MTGGESNASRSIEKATIITQRQRRAISRIGHVEIQRWRVIDVALSRNERRQNYPWSSQRRLLKKHRSKDRTPIYSSRCTKYGKRKQREEQGKQCEEQGKQRDEEDIKVKGEEEKSTCLEKTTVISQRHMRVACRHTIIVPWCWFGGFRGQDMQR